MAFDIGEFQKQIGGQLAREAFFDVNITFPEFLGGSASSRLMTFLCVASNLPARQASISMVRTGGMGLTRSFVTGMQYSALDLTFYCDVNSNALKLFNSWLDYMLETKISGEMNLIEYRDNYTTKIVLNQYTDVVDGKKKGKKTASWTFKEAFPYSVGPINFSWGSRNNLILIPAAFLYYNYHYDDTPDQSTDNPFNNLQLANYNLSPVRGIDF
jgi:hypothetical protein